MADAFKAPPTERLRAVEGLPLASFGRRAAALTIDFFLVAYFTLATWLGHGQTIGKRLCRIRVVSLVHDHLTLWHAFERALGYGASTLEAGFGFFQYFIRPDRRTVHDRIAETIVIRTGSTGCPGSDDGETSTTPGAS